MKPTPHYDFPISVRRQTWEEEPDEAHFYEGIFTVNLNYSSSLLFVPVVERIVWPPSLSGRTDSINSEQEARLFTLALSRYSVTPDPERAGQEEMIPGSLAELEPGVIFYVSDHEFFVFSQELGKLADERPSVHSAWRISEIMDLEVSNFILSRLLISKHISRRDLELLGR
jgi:hypothetical protein